jgi:hypothetical protein
MTSEVFLARVRDASRLAPGKDDIVVLKVMPKARVIDMGHRVQELVVSERSSMMRVQGSKFILHLVRRRLGKANLGWGGGRQLVLYSERILSKNPRMRCCVASFAA